jgi:hypothetical protein
MSNITVVFSDDHKSITLVGVNGNRVTRKAAVTLNVSFRKDGGATVWGDGEHKSQTVRVDSYGRMMNTRKALK